MDERAAITRMLAGDIGGLEHVVRAYQVRAVRAAYLITRDAALAEDVVQSAFLKAYERIAQLDPERPFGPWFLRSVANDAIKAAERRGRQVALGSEDEADRRLAVTVGRGEGPEQILERAQATSHDPANPAGPAGSLAVFNGGETWIVWTDPTGSRVLHTHGTTWNRPGEAPSSAGTLTEFLATYERDRPCVGASLQGEASVAGRAAHVLAIQPKRLAVGCKTPPTTVWLDTQTFLPLKWEVRDPSGAIAEQSEVASVEFNVAIPPSLFEYAPPAGVRVYEFSGGSGADAKRTVFERNAPGRLPDPKKGPTPAHS